MVQTNSSCNFSSISVSFFLNYEFICLFTSPVCPVGPLTLTIPRTYFRPRSTYHQREAPPVLPLAQKPPAKLDARAPSVASLAVDEGDGSRW